MSGYHGDPYGLKAYRIPSDDERPARVATHHHRPADDHDHDHHDHNGSGTHSVGERRAAGGQYGEPGSPVDRLAHGGDVDPSGDHVKVTFTPDEVNEMVGDLGREARALALSFGWSGIFLGVLFGLAIGVATKFGGTWMGLSLIVPIVLVTFVAFPAAARQMIPDG